MVWKQLTRALIASDSVLGRVHARLSDSFGCVLMYHEIARDDVEAEAWTVVRRGDFERQIEYLRHHFDIVSLDAALQQADTGRTCARPLAVVTFDDGHRGNFDLLLPLVDALDLPVTIFVATGHVETGRLYWFDRVVNALQGGITTTVDLRDHGLARYVLNGQRGAGNWRGIQSLLTDLKAVTPERREGIVEHIVAQTVTPAGAFQLRPLTIDQVQHLARDPRITIGAHSHCHNLLSQLPVKEAQQSMARSRERLENWLSRPVRHFAYPNGSFTPLLMEAARQCGFASACTTEPKRWQPCTSRFAIPRMAVGRYDSMASFRLALVGGPRAAVRYFVAPSSA